MRFGEWMLSSSAWVTVFLPIAGTAVGQVPDSAQRRPAAVIGQVVDSSGVGVGGAEIMVLAGDKPVADPTASDPQGNFRFHGLPPGGPYTLVARQMGYQPARGRGFHLRAGDTLRLRFVLNPIVVVLDSITVKGRRKSRSSFFADEFASKVKVRRNALDLIAWHRPYMLGDPEFCSPPDSFGRPTQDRTRFKPTRNLSLYTGESQAGVKRLWLDPLRFGSDIDTDSMSLPYVRQVYVNGLRVDRPGDPIRTPLRMLRAIPSHHVAEMHYIDCWDKTMALGMQYSIFVTLKSLSPAQQDSMFRFILAGAAASGPVDGKVLSVKRPTRAAWDSIIQLLTGRGSGDAAHDSTKAEPSP
jgi:hypothetical protein